MGHLAKNGSISTGIKLNYKTAFSAYSNQIGQIYQE